MDPAFPLVAFVGAFVCTRLSLGAGMAFAIGVGYFNGVVRANYLSVWTTFMFDGGLLGLYAGFLTRPETHTADIWGTTTGGWMKALIAWPVLLTAVPINDYLVQAVALRGTVWFLPTMLIASRFGPVDVAVLARAMAGLNLIALAAGIYLYHYGVEAFFPDNAVTEIIYKSRDVAGGKFRIPSTFLSAHAYGGAMVGTLGFLLGRLLDRKVGFAESFWLAAGVGAAVGGALLCAARQPVVGAALTFVAAWVISGFSWRLGVAVGVLASGGIYLALTDERLQRVTTLEDSEYVQTRVEGSANDHFVAILIDYPMGAGMGSSAGTSIPFFLADRAPKQIGLENEYSRILVDQGWVGLGLWLAFLGWLYAKPPPATGGSFALGTAIMYAGTGLGWATAFIGTGTLSAIPGSVLLLVQMGIVANVRETARDQRG